MFFFLFSHRGTGAAESDLEEGPETHVEVPKKTSKSVGFFLNSIEFHWESNFSDHVSQPTLKGIHKTQSAVRLQEIGPRMNLQLIKIEEGLCDGAVLFHEYGIQCLTINLRNKIWMSPDF